MKKINKLRKLLADPKYRNNSALVRIILKHLKKEIDAI